MKYFHLSLGFRIKDRPKWLEEFRKEYDKPYPYHVTLKNETELKEGDIQALKKKVAEILKGYNSKDLDLVFDRVNVNETSKGHCIMVAACDGGQVKKLQAEIVSKLNVFGDISSEDHKRFEENFDPHITIARHLTDRQLLQAEKDLPNKVRFEIEPEKLVLSIVNEPVIEERLKEKNRSYFYF